MLCARTRGWKTRGGDLSERGRERRSVGTAPAAAGARRGLWQGRGQQPWPASCPCWPLAAPGMSRLCPEERESVPRQRGETTLLPGEDDSALPEALSCFMPGIYRSSAILPLRPHTSNKPRSRCVAGAARAGRAGSGGARSPRREQRELRPVRWWMAISGFPSRAFPV